MKLAIYDKGGGNFRDTAREAAQAIFERHELPTFDPTIAGAVDDLRKFSHVVCHLTSDRTDPSWLKLVEGDLIGVKVIIRVSSQGAGGMSDSFKTPHRLNGSGPWILHLLERSSDVSVDLWKRIFIALHKWQAEMGELSNEVAAIFDPRPDIRLAFCLLREAKAFCDDLASKPCPTSGITIHSPMTLIDWLEPFKNKETTELKQLAELIVSEDRTKASDDVKKAILSSGDLESAVRNYLKIEPVSSQSLSHANPT